MSNNYWTPLADQVEVSENFDIINTITEDDKENVEPRYSLPFGGTTTSHNRLQERRLLRLKEKKDQKKLGKQVLKERVLNGQEPYSWLDSGATSNFVAPQDKQHAKGLGKPSTKVVRMANGKMEAAGKQMELNNGLRQPANKADSIPSLKTTLISNSKLADAGYITVYNDKEVNVYDSKTTSVIPTKAAIMTGWRNKRTRLWRIPIQNSIANKNTDTRLL
jgi:hypothetical protein